MPQMAPYNWLILNFMFMSIFFIHSNFIYFLKLKINNKMFMNKSISKYKFLW